MAEAAPVEAEAEYQDGQQARSLWLRARLTPSTLELRRAGGEVAAAWPVSSLRVVDRAAGVLRLAPDGSDARLLVSDAKLAAALEAAQRPRRRAEAKRRLRMAALAAVVVPAAALGLWRGWPPAADAIARAVPADWERSIGAAAAATVIGGKRDCDAPEGRAALDALVAKLAAAGGVASPAAVRVRVVDDPTVNALAAPGGDIIVYRGLLERAESAGELAGVLAHELGHVEHRHGLRSLVRVAGLFVLSGALSGGSDAVALGAALVGLSYSRDFEREADADAARTLAAAGIGTAGLEAFFARMQRPGAPNRVWGYVSTHPADADRAAALRNGTVADAAPALSAAGWAAVRNICGPVGTGRPAGDAARSNRAVQGQAQVQGQAPARRRLGTFAGWEAWAGEEPAGPLCYAVAQAVPAPGDKPTGRSKLWVTHRPWRVMDDIGFVPGEKPPDRAAMWIEFGGRRDPMRMRGSYAAPRDGAALSAALRAAAADGVAEAVVSWSGPENGAAPFRSHRFALGGFAEAHAAIGQACRAAP